MESKTAHTQTFEVGNNGKEVKVLDPLEDIWLAPFYPLYQLLCNIYLFWMDHALQKCDENKLIYTQDYQ